MAAPARAPAWYTMDLTLLGVCLVLAALSLGMTPTTEAVQLFGWEVPPLCAIKNLFGVNCPGCGLSRSFVFLGHGDLDTAWQMNVLGPFLYLLLWSQIPYRLIRLARGYRQRAAVAARAD